MPLFMGYAEDMEKIKIGEDFYLFKSITRFAIRILNCQKFNVTLSYIEMWLHSSSSYH